MIPEKALSLLEKKTSVIKSRSLAGLAVVASRAEELRRRRIAADEGGRLLRALANDAELSPHGDIPTREVSRWKRRLQFRSWCTDTAARVQKGADRLGAELSRLEWAAAERRTAVCRLDERREALLDRIQSGRRLASVSRDIREENEYAA